MRIVLITEEGNVFSIEVSEDMDLASFKALCEVETDISSETMDIFFEGKILNDFNKPLSFYNIKDGEVILIKNKEIENVPMDFFSNPTDLVDPVRLRNEFLKDQANLAVLRHNNPIMAEALEKSEEEFVKYFKNYQKLKKEEQERINKLMRNPYDISAQQLIAEEIRKNNVERNMQAAMEYHPESFGQVTMLYINCKVNGYPVKAFIDSGAQVTIMSKSCAEKCEIMRLIDHRFAGTARGVGVQKISGRVHLCQIQIENDFLPSSFTILEDQDMEVMLGLDMLKRHQCCVDLKRNVLVIGTTGTETRFLSENEIPQVNNDEKIQLTEAINRSIRENQPSSSSQIDYSESLLKEFLAMGFKREDIIKQLRAKNNDKNEALAALLALSLSGP